MEKKASRLRRAKRSRRKSRELSAHRLSVHRTPRHIYAQVIAPDGGTVLATASTVQKDVRGGLKGTGNVDAAKAVGKLIPNVPKRPASKWSHSTAPVSVITAASKRWPTLLVKRD